VFRPCFAPSEPKDPPTLPSYSHDPQSPIFPAPLSALRILHPLCDNFFFLSPSYWFFPAFLISDPLFKIVCFLSLASFPLLQFKSPLTSLLHLYGPPVRFFNVVLGAGVWIFSPPQSLVSPPGSQTPHQALSRSTNFPRPNFVPLLLLNPVWLPCLL